MRRTVMILFSVVMVSLLVVTSVAAAPATSPSMPAVKSAPGYHVVRPGETLFSIGRLYGVNPYAIAAANHLPNANYIWIGQCLYIPARSCYYTGCGCRYYNYCRYPQYCRCY